MKAHAVAFILAALVTALVTPIVRRNAPRVGAVDLPSGRRVNRKIVPRLGGIAILAGFLLALFVFVLDQEISGRLVRQPSRLASLLLGGLALAGVGALDDMRGLRARFKLFAQIAVAIGAYVGGFRIEGVVLPLIGSFDMGILSLPVTVIWIVGIVNAVNFIDGLDGLAAGVGFFVCVVNFVAGVFVGNEMVPLFSAALGGSLLAFLFFNFNPASIYMGDSGSMFVGFTLATVSLMGAKGTTAVSLLVPVLALGLPIMDALFAVIRRFLYRRPLFSPDRGHIHHRLLDMGITHRRAVLILYGATAVLTAAAITVCLGRDWQVGMAVVAACLVVVGTIRAVVPFEFRAIRSAQRAGQFSTHGYLFRRSIPDYMAAVSAAEDPAQLVEALKKFAVRTDLVMIKCSAAEMAGLGNWTWERENGGSGLPEGGRDFVSAVFPIRGAQGAAGTIKFGWQSDTGDVSPQSDTLLRVVVDATEKRLGEMLGFEWLPGVAKLPLGQD